jgi:DNA polymerase
LVQGFANKEDVYKKMASAIYGVAEDQITKDQRFVGKTTILGAGYGMGALKFQAQLKTFGFDMELDEARRVINIYRLTNDRIVELWREAQTALVKMVNGEGMYLGVPKNVLTIKPKVAGIWLPSGLMMRYDGLEFEPGEKGPEFSYATRKGRTRIYGGKIVENVCQAVARCIIGEQMLRIAKRYKVVLTVHDAIACVVRNEEVEEATQFVEACMRWTPDWAVGLPLNCESGYGDSYGDC